MIKRFEVRAGEIKMFTDDETQAVRDAVILADSLDKCPGVIVMIFDNDAPNRLYAEGTKKGWIMFSRNK